jgi:ribosome maturation factor RimP
MKEWAGIIESEVRSFGARVYDWRLSGDTLQVFIDTDTGVTIELCAEVSKVLSRYFSDYTVEVSSPGIERPLSKPEHFMRYRDKKIQVNTKQGAIIGTLASVNDDGIQVRISDERVEAIQFSEIKSAFLKVTTEELFRRTNG